MVRTERNLHEVRDLIRRGDLLLFRGTGWASDLIRAAGRSEYSHAAMVDWWDDEPYCCEVRELKGGRIVTLASQVQRYPGRIDVYVANPHNLSFDRAECCKYMRRFAGTDYGYGQLWKAALLHLPFIRLFARPNYVLENGDVPVSTPFCSQAVAMAVRYGGGHDPVPNLPDRLTEPGDLGRSDFFNRLCTLSGL